LQEHLDKQENTADLSDAFVACSWHPWDGLWTH